MATINVLVNTVRRKDPIVLREMIAVDMVYLMCTKDTEERCAVGLPAGRKQILCMEYIYRQVCGVRESETIKV